MTQSIYNNETLTESVQAEGLLTAPTVGTWQEDFNLSEADFVRLKSGKPVTFNWANSILLTSIGWGFNILSKWFPTFKDPAVQSKITDGEIYTLVAGCSLALILYLIGLTMPNDRKTVMKSIETHFKNAEKSKHVRKS